MNSSNGARRENTQKTRAFVCMPHKYTVKDKHKKLNKMKHNVFIKVTSIIAITLIAVCSIFAVPACKEKDKIENKTVVFYSDFYMVNCPVDSISIYIDNNHVGKLLKSYIPDSPQTGTRNSENTLETKVLKGKHIYSAKANGGCNAYWSGEFDATVDIEINLKMSDAKILDK